VSADDAKVSISRRDLLFLTLAGFFLTNAILGEVTGGKLFVAPGGEALRKDGVVLSIGVLMWPVVFLTTDLVNEYFGKAGVRRLTWLGLAMISYAFVVLRLCLWVPFQSPGFGVSYDHFQGVFGTSTWMIVGSLLAFVTSQIIDIAIFSAFKARTGQTLLWLRATGSTAVSQLVDSYVVGLVGFWVPSVLGFGDPEHPVTLGLILPVCGFNYLYKLLIAVLITPLLYVAHAAIDRWLAGGPKPTGVADWPGKPPLTAQAPPGPPVPNPPIPGV
jgi:uncharacterized integral membrane protein (TIGR00697 family)